MAMFDVLNANNELFCIYVTWCGILLIKTLLMSVLTVYHRRKNNAMCNPEDCCLGKHFEVKTHEDVERCRRAHLNDLENIVPFLIIGLLFVLTEPHIVVTCWLFRIVGVTRILHSIFYAVYPIRQPTRAILYYTTYIISLYMALSSVVYFFKI